MKYPALIAIAIFFITGCTSHSSKTRTVKIDDNDKMIKIEESETTMSIQAKTRNTRNPVDYNKTFKIGDLNDRERKELQNHILDSLGITIK